MEEASREGTAKVDFFISYTGADKAWADWIAWKLEEAGYTIVYQAWDFRPGREFVTEMHQALRRAQRVLAVLSPAYLDSKFARQEWNAALADDPTGALGRLLPVRVAEVALEGLDRSRIYVDLVGLPKEEAKRRLLAGVRAERAKPSIEPGFPQRVDHPPTASEARTGVVGRAMNLEPGRGQDRPAVQHVSKATLEPATTTHNLQLRRERAGAILENEMQAASEPVVGFTPRLTPASHTGRVASLRRMASLCALAGLETAAVLSLHWLGRFGSLQVDWREPVLWLTASPLQDVIGAVIRTIGLILAYWLLASTLLYLVADLTRLPAVMRAVRPIIQPLFQRLTNSLRQVLQRISKNDGG